MHKIWAVMRREFIEKVRTKWFIIGTVLGPVLMLGIVALPILLADRTTNRVVGVLDATTEGFGDRLAGMLQRTGSVTPERIPVDAPDLEDRAAELARRVGPGFDGFIILTDAVTDDGHAEYRGRNVSSLSDMQTLSVVLRNAVFS